MWLPAICRKCNKFGHKEAKCPTSNTAELAHRTGGQSSAPGNTQSVPASQEGQVVQERSTSFTAQTLTQARECGAAGNEVTVEPQALVVYAGTITTEVMNTRTSIVPTPLTETEVVVTVDENRERAEFSHVEIQGVLTLNSHGEREVARNNIVTLLSENTRSSGIRREGIEEFLNERNQFEALADNDEELEDDISEKEDELFSDHEVDVREKVNHNLRSGNKEFDKPKDKVYTSPSSLRQLKVCEPSLLEDQKVQEVVLEKSTKSMFEPDDQDSQNISLIDDAEDYGIELFDMFCPPIFDEEKDSISTIKITSLEYNEEDYSDAFAVLFSEDQLIMAKPDSNDRRFERLTTSLKDLTSSSHLEDQRLSSRKLKSFAIAIFWQRGRRGRSPSKAYGQDNSGAEDLPGGGGSKYGTSVKKEVAMDSSRDIILAYMQNEESQNYYHFKDNRVLPSHVDPELANSEGAAFSVGNMSRMSVEPYQLPGSCNRSLNQAYCARKHGSVRKSTVLSVTTSKWDDVSTKPSVKTIQDVMFFENSVITCNETSTGSQKFHRLCWCLHGFSKESSASIVGEDDTLRFGSWSLLLDLSDARDQRTIDRTFSGSLLLNLLFWGWILALFERNAIVSFVKMVLYGLKPPQPVQCQQFQNCMR
ncbi:hypothetical protein IFM89_030546 [Coptis chinensis]|uniref:CCHC-type domain-containing protein n=1 Tax=Coptis chinensis TaxID=261450 RepID=A0A835HR15_9MAGN|nr:hypothetical protein IFM89_030546 [Coptis chinensis]